MSTGATQAAPPAPIGERTAEVYRIAAELMVEKGFGGTSMADIAKVAGMTKAGLYHHIASKQDMLYRIMKHTMDAVESNVIAPAESISDPEARLREVIRLHVLGTIKQGCATAILMGQVRFLERAQKEKIIARIKNYQAFVEQAMKDLEQRGRLRDLDTHIAMMHLMNALMGIANWRSAKSHYELDQVVEDTTTFIMGAILKD